MQLLYHRYFYLSKRIVFKSSHSFSLITYHNVIFWFVILIYQIYLTIFEIMENIAISDYTPTAIILIRNLEISTTKAVIRKIFGHLGIIIKLMKHNSISNDNNNNLSFAFVEYLFPQDAAKAVLKMDGYQIENGTKLVVHLMRFKKCNGKVLYCYLKCTNN